MEFQAFILSLLLLTIVSQTESRSLDTTLQCATTCTESNIYQEGYTYAYEYEAVVNSFVDSIDGPHSTRLTMQLNTQVSVLSPCELVLKVTRATISDDSSNIDTADWTDLMTRNPLHFSWQDGKIPQICASNDDPSWVLNVKRGVLSTMIQPGNLRPNSNPITLSMTDVTGECEWDYDVTETGGVTHSRATKDYSKCQGRSQQLLLSHFNKYYSDSEQQSFVKSSQECDQTIRDGAIIQTDCTEEHVFVPFSKEDSGIRTRITQSSTRVSKQLSYSVDTLGESDVRRTSIVFEKEENSFSSTDISEVQSVVSNLCEIMGTELYSQVGEDFIKMVFLLRRLDPSALEQVHSSLDGACPVHEEEIKAMFQDALQWCGSEGCVVFAARMIERGEMTDAIAARWLTSMSLIAEPTIPMLRALTAVVRSGRLADKSYLTMGTMIHRLHATVDDCMSDPDVVIALELLERKLGVNCRTSNPETKQEILYVLRAIGNAGGFTSPSILAECARESDNDMETRIAAVQAFRRMPCNTDRSVVSRLLFDAAEDSELRIGAYMALMQCPTPSFIKQVIQMLDNEPIQQVASFVWTHLQQLQESTDPLKGYIKPLLVEAEFAKQHDLDPRKFSRFYEATLFSDALNAGATVESSVVWSPKSFVPRSGSIDMSLDVFGQAVNLFEIGGRVEGVETLIQSFLGPKGYLKNNRLSDLFTADVEDDETDEDDDEPEEPVIGRSARSSSDSRLREIKQQHDSRVPTENKPSASWYLRLFGNEMYYKNTNGMAPLSAESESIDLSPILTRLATGSDFKYHDDMMLMNSAFVIPTIAGLPLTLAFNGTASIDVTANGHLDMTQFFTPQPTLDILGSLKPRGVVLVTGAMSVDAHVTRIGLATESSALTSWTLGGRISVDQGQSVTVKVDAPYQRNTVFSFKHKLMKIVGNQKVTPNDGLLGLSQIESDCQPEFAGQRMCISNSMTRYPSEEVGSYVLPTSGPLTIDIYLEKTDTGFDHYLMQAQYSTEYSQGSEIPTVLTTSMVLDTPGSSINRRTNLNLNYNTNDMTFNLDFTHPTQAVALSGSIENGLSRKEVVVTYRRNKEQSSFTATYEKLTELTETRWELNTVLQMPSKTVNGHALMVLDPSRKAILNMTIDNLMADPIALNFALRDESAGSRLIYGGNGLLKIPGMIDSGVGFDVNIKPRSDAFSFKLDYEFSGQEQQSILFVHKRRSRSTSTVTKWEATQKLACSQYPIVNHHIFCNYSNGPGAISSYVKVGYGRHAGHDDNSKYISISQSFTKSESIDSNSLEGSLALRMPSFNVDYSAGLQHTYSESSFNTAMNLAGYEMSVMMENLTQQNGGLVHLNMETQFPTLWGQIHYNETVRETQKSMYHINSQLSVGSSQAITLRGDIYFDNLAERKRLESTVRGANNDLLWHQRSIFEFLTPSGFLTQHSLESQFNRLVNVSIRHEGQKQGGFETNVVAVYEPSIFADLKIDFESTDTDCAQLVRLDFLNELGIKRFLQVNTHKMATTTATEGSYSGTFVFTTDVASIPVKSVSGETSLETSLDSTSSDGSLVVDDSELLGFSASHSYSIGDDLLGMRTVDITLRQRMCEFTPNKLVISTSIQSTMDNGQTVTFNYNQDDVEKLVTSLQIAMDSQTIEGQASQHFSTDFPTEMTYVVRAITNGVNMRLGVDGRTATLEVAKASDSSVRLTWSHNLPSLRAQEVPISIESTLSWGQQPSSGSKGAWMMATVNRLQDFNAQALYNSESKRVTFSVRHDVSSLYQFIPQIEAIASSLITRESGHIRSSIHVNTTEISLNELTWSPTELQVRVHHAVPLLDSYKIPRLNELLMEYTGESTDNGRVRIVTDVDSVHSELILTSSPAVASIRYTSNCPVIGGDVELAYQKQSTDGSFTITYTRNGIEKSATIGINFDDSSNSFNANWNQNIIVCEDCPMIPRSGSARFGYVFEDTAFGADTQLTYNDYHGELSTQFSYPITKKKALVSFEVTLGQNVLETASNFHTILMARTDYSSEVFTSLKYTLDEDLERFVRVRLHFDDGVESGTGVMEATARFNHNQPIQPVPRSIITTVTITPQSYGYETALSVTTNDNVERISLVGGFNPESNTVTVGYAQGIPYLTELGVFQNVTLVMSGGLQESDVGFSINGRFSVQIDDEVYSASASSGYEMGDSDITVTSDLSQQIAPLIMLGVPKRVHKVTTLNYGLLDKTSMSGALQLTSNVERTVYDLDTNTDTQIQNQIQAEINVELFNWHVSFSGSHDFDFADIPHNIQYEIAASGSADGSPVFHKSLTMSVTLDGVKQTASVTMNRNKASRSFYLSSKHNVTKILAYGVPGNMSIDFQMNDNLDADLKIVYDTAKKSVGFKLDYDGNQKKLVFYFNHNFDMIVENWSIPKSMGFESQCLVNADNMQLMLKYVWGNIISKAEVTSGWHGSWDMPSLNIRMTQNMTTDEVFPVSITFDGSAQSNQGFTTNLHTSRGYARLSCSQHDMGGTLTDVTCSLRQNFDSLIVPRLSELEATFNKGEGTRTVQMTVSCDREQKLQTTMTTTWNVENLSASVSVSNTQEFVENDVFPSTFTLYTNGSVRNPRFTTFTSLTRSNGDPFQLSVDTGYDIEDISAYLLIKHKQTAWKAVLPRTFRVDGSFTSDSEGVLITVVTKRGRKTNRITAGYGYHNRDETVYGRVSYNHDFADYQEKVPMHGMTTLLLGKTTNSLFGHVNVTMDDIALTHSAQANYNKLADSMSVMAEVILNNQYLQELGVPHTVSASASYDMINNMRSAASIHYGDKSFTVTLESDEETSAVLHVQQNFDFKPNDVRVSVTGSMTDRQATMEITIDGVTQDIVLSGNYAPGEANVQLIHGFDNSIIPTQVSLGGSYRLTPDVYVSANANVDGSQYSVSGGYEKLTNGFRVSSSLLDDVSRSATFRQNMLPGGISFELDHTIPELEKYVPQSVGVSASARLSPRPNITASIRQENTTQRFTAETDLPTLQFSLNHDVALLPIPRSITFKISGSLNPPQGSIKMVVDGQTRTATAEVDPTNLVASFIHNIPEIPLPESLSVEVSGSMSPPSGSLFVTIDGKREEVTASVNPTEMSGAVRQTSSFLSSLMIPNDIAFGVKGSAESMSGEIYISIDGKLRNIGGSVNKPRGLASFFHSMPEIETYLPRNITVRITGGMEPLQGSITLTMDEVERQVTGQVNTRSPFMFISHTVPEIDEYFPRDLRASLGFTSESVQASVSYTKLSVEKMASFGVDFSPNHVRIQAAQTMIEGKNVPSQITVDVAGSVEYKNFTVMTEFDSSYFNLNGNVLVGTNSDGWYGITTSAQHNVRMLRKKLLFPKNLQVEFKGRKSGKTFETAIVLDLIKAHDYQGYASITPTPSENQFNLRTEYTHTYNGLTRSVSGSATASNSNGYSITVDGSQTSPEAYNIGFSVSKELTVADNVQGRVTFSGRQNIPELVEAGVPSIIQNGVVTFDLSEPIGNVVFSMTMDGEAHDVRVDYNRERSQNSFTMRTRVVVAVPDVNMDTTTIVSLSRAQDMSWMQVSYEMTQPNPARADSVIAKVYIDEMNPRITLKLKQKELNDRYRMVPVQNELSFLRRDVSDEQIDWSLRLTCAEESMVVGLKATQRLPSHLNWNLFFDHNVHMLSELVPSHLASKFNTNYLPTAEQTRFDFAIGVELDQFYVWYNMSEVLGSTHGTATQKMSHNTGPLFSYLGWMNYVETYTYDIVNDVLTLNGQVTHDTRSVRTYTFTLNYNTKAIHYEAGYEQSGYEADYRFNLNGDSIDLLISLNKSNSNKFNIAFTKDESHITANFHCDLYVPEITSEFVHVSNDEGCQINLATEVRFEENTYSTEVTFVPVTDEEMKGRSLSVIYSVSDGSRLTFNMSGKCNGGSSGNMDINLINNNVIEGLARRTKIVESYTLSGYNFAYTSDRQRIVTDATYSSRDNAYDINWNFYQNVMAPTYPRDFTSSVNINAESWRAHLTVDEIEMILFNVANQEITARIKTLTGSDVFHLTGNYVVQPSYEVDVTVNCVPLELNLSFSGAFTFMEQSTGNSSLIATLQDLNTDQSVHFNMYAHPTGTAPADFYGGLFLLSDLSIAPFTFTSSLNSTYDAQGTYSHDFQMRWNDNVLALVGSYAEQTFRLSLTQPWTETVNTIIFSGANRSSTTGEKTKSVAVQWGEESDAFGVTLVSLKQPLQDRMTMTLNQPSGVVGFQEWEGIVNVDKTTANVYNFNFRSQLDGTPTSLIVNYQGALPQPLGHHELVVTITQPFTTKIPTTFVTTGIMTISSAWLYESDWRITSEGRDLAALVKNYRPSANGYSFDFMWKQSYVNMPGSFISIASQSETSEGQVTNTASLQVDQLPVMSSNIMYSNLQDDGMTNISSKVSLKTGPLSRFLFFRDLDVTSWYKNAYQQNRKMPAFSTTIIVDGKQYHVDGSFSSKTRDSDVRFIGDLTIQHPHKIVLFGKRMPSSNTGNFKLVVKPKGSQINLNYDNELMDNEINIFQQYRVANGDRLLHYSARVKYSAEDQPDDVTTGILVVRNDNNFDNTATVNFAYPAANIDSQMIMSGLNSESSIATEVLFKNYDGAERKLWKFAVSYGKSSNIITVTINSPDMEETTLRGDLSQVIRQAGHLIEALSSDATSTGLRFIKGMIPTETGFDMYLGYQYNDGPKNTLHLIVGYNNDMAFALLEVKRDFVSEAKIGKVSINLVDPRLVQIEMKAYPVVTDFLRQMFSVCDNEVARKINWLADQLVDFLLSCKTVVSGSESVERMSESSIDGLIRFINQIRSTSVQSMTSTFNGMSDNFDSSHTVIQALLRQAINMIDETITSLRNVVAGPFAELIDQHYGVFLNRIATSLKVHLRFAVDILSRVNADEVFQELVDEAVQKTSDFILANGEALFMASRRPLAELIAVTDSELIINIPLEFELDHFVPLPSLEDLKTWAAQTALAMKIDEAVSKLYSYVDQYYRVRAVVYMPRDELLPPFKGHAFVSGFRHFSTFDKRHIDFSSSCPTTHVLATDMRNDNFTITLSYGDTSADSVPSIEIIIENRRVVVFSDYSVQVNGRTKDVPLVVGKIAVTREGKTVHIRHVEGDVDVGCDFSTQLCTVDVSPYYFGATGGLAGTYNNEPSDDVMGPALNQLDDVATMASQWETSDTTCASGNAYRPCASNSVQAICRQLFENTNSPFRSCFPLVDPKTFMHMCQDDMCDDNNAAKSCSASSAYLYRCKLAGAPLTMPDHCVMCSDVHGHQFSAARSRNAEITGVDLVFVVQESACMQRTSKAMRKFIKRLSSEMNSEGLRNSRYYMVGYGGIDGSEAPHTYTFNNEPFTTRKNSLSKTIRRMQLAEQSTNPDALEAISYATKLPFRAGAKPIIVLVSCDDCSFETKVSFGNVESQLRTRRIGFHHLPHHAITAGSKSMFGYDRRTAFSKHNLDSSVIKPSKTDSCVPLATVTEGSVWDSRQLSDKTFQSRLGNYLARSAQSGTTVTCTCQMNEEGVASPICTP